MNDPQREARGQDLTWLLDGLAEVPSSMDHAVSGLALDSRVVRPGDLFLACRGEHDHGAAYIDAAVRAGAAVVAWEPADGVAVDAGSYRVPVIAVPGLRGKAGIIASRFYGEPSHSMKVIGVTGTNGKTSVTHLVAQALTDDGQRCGLLGTLGYGFPGRLEHGPNTTPDPITLHRLLADLKGHGAAAAAIEVSSHALAQYRTGGVRFAVAAFTNLTRDHLDYHPDIGAYGRAKRRLFEHPGLGHAVINTDDAFGREILRGLSPGIEAIAVGTPGGSMHPGPSECATRFVEVTHMDPSTDGLQIRLETERCVIEFASRLVGTFNAHNLALAAGILVALGMKLERSADRLSAVDTVPGRMESFGGGEDAPLVVVDYAHTPDALEQVLRAVRAHCSGSLWCVFGCGGDRDRGKRPQMGAIAGAWADQVVLTDDNPRNEDPVAIIEDILGGIPARTRVEVEHDRATAIARTVSSARPGDIVVVAGKGHEDYQVVGAEIRPFSDRDTVLDLISGDYP